MEAEERPHEDNDREEKSKQNNTAAEHKKFVVELTGSQACALESLLPKGHCLQVDREAKAKRANNKKKLGAAKK
jgi:hypothetical protein